MAFGTETVDRPSALVLDLTRGDRREALGAVRNRLRPKAIIRCSSYRFSECES